MSRDCKKIKLQQEIDDFKAKLEVLTAADSPSDQNYLINAYKRCICIRQRLLERAGDTDT